MRTSPDLTVADLERDLAAAQARPSIHTPIGLVCAAWLEGSRVTAPRPRPAPAEAPPAAQPESTATERYLLDQGFSARVAHEFRGFDEGAVVAICEQTFSPHETQRERNYKIGKLVVRWRNQPPDARVSGIGVRVSGSGDRVSSEPTPDIPDIPAIPDTRADSPDTRADSPAGPPLDLTDLPAIWARACALLQMWMPRSAFEACLDRTALLSLGDGVATIGFLRPAQREQAQDNHLGAIRRALCEVTELEVRVRCVLRRA